MDQTSLPDRIHRERRRADILNALRTSGLTQTQIGAAHGVSQAYVSRVAKTANEIYTLLERWGVTIDDLAEELPWEEWHEMVTWLEVDNLCRRRGYRGLDDERLSAKLAFERRCSAD